MRQNYRIGLDVGTNSLGWSVLSLDKTDTPGKIEAAGARIFADGRDVKTKATLAATRRTARSARRRRDRFKQRQIFLLDELTKAGLFPEDEQARKDLQKKNPLELRARALKEKLPLHEIGRAVFHINQRRGFQSNRKDRSEEVTNGKISRSARRLLEEMGLINPPMPTEEYKKLSKEGKKSARQQESKDRNNALEKLAEQKNLTYGSFLYARHRCKKPTRARPGTGEDKLYDVYPTRELYKDEFDKIWTAQAAHHSDLMTDAVRDRIDHVIFTQRPLRPQKVGMCAYLKGEERAFRAMPSFQRYRIFQEVNNLEWATSAGKMKLIDFPEGRDAIISLLEKPSTKKGNVVFGKMKTELKKWGIAEGNFTFNFETPKRTEFLGNTTSHFMRDAGCVGARWDAWSLEQQDGFVAGMLEKKPDESKAGEMREQTDDEVKARLRNDYQLTEYAANNCLEATAKLDDGTAALSLKAARLLLEKMDKGVMIQSDAVEKAAEEHQDFINPFTRMRNGELQDRLPYYGEVFAADGRHIIPGDRLPEEAHDERKFFGGVTNPTVHIALNQIRQVVNELIDRYGHPTSIAIELGRNLPAGQEGRREIEKEQKKNQYRNKRLDKILLEYGQEAKGDNRLRLLLWEELDDDPSGRLCPFSGDAICVADLFNGDAEIEHLIPFSRSLDDSRANKVICSRTANREKGNRTPFEAFGHSPNGYAWKEIFERAKKLPKPKQWRFQEDAMEIWARDNDFTARHLNDTRYIGRLTREYLECICRTDKIDVLTGRLTALLRGHWGLNSVLRGDKEPLGGQSPKKKNRDDHRHHAVDAIVIGMTSRAMLQKVSSAANRAEELRLASIFEKHNGGKSAIDPWDGFRNDVREAVQNIIVSHKSRRKKIVPNMTDGQLHNDTALGLIKPIDEAKNEYETVVRRPIDYMADRKRVETIRDPHLRAAFIQGFDGGGSVGKSGKEAVRDLAGKKGIRRLRCFGPKQAIPIKDKHGKVYKGYQGDSNWGMEIYAFPEGSQKAGEWEGVAISRFNANKSGFQPGTTYRPEPTAYLVMRLQVNDCVEIEESGERRIMRLQQALQSGTLIFVPPNAANTYARDRNKNVTGTYRNEDFAGKITGGGQNKRVKIIKLGANKVDLNAELDDPELNWNHEDNFEFDRLRPSSLKARNARKVHISPTGKINYEVRRKPRRKS